MSGRGHQSVRKRDSGEFTFCCCFTSRTGVIICTYQGLTLLSVTAICTLFNENEEPNIAVRISEYLIISLFIFLMATGYLLGFWSAYTYEVVLAKVATVLLALGSLLYFLLSIISFTSSDNLRSSVCVDNRCPDHHWLQSDGWRHQVYRKEEGSEMPGETLYTILSFLLSLCILAHYLYTTFIFYGFMVFLKNLKHSDVA